MKALVFSDSHGFTSKMIEIIENTKDISMVIHLGDVIKDAEEIELIFNSKKVEYVPGNNDWYFRDQNEKIIEIEGKRFLLTHGNLYGVKNGYERIAQKGKAMNVDVVLFGHTHIAYEGIHDNVLLINPGSISYPASGRAPSYCILDVTRERVVSKLNRIEN